jgi:hypothetical protein
MKIAILFLAIVIATVLSYPAKEGASDPEPIESKANLTAPNEQHGNKTRPKGDSFAIQRGNKLYHWDVDLPFNPLAFGK